jgi:hypothetical protein
MKPIDELRAIAARIKADSVSHFAVARALAAHHARLQELIASTDEQRAEEILRQIQREVPELTIN